jgi:mono/diheme cytochrome c family protein
MRKLVLFLVVVLVIGAAGYFILNRTDDSEGQAPVLAGAPTNADVLARGEYLTKAADCIACHTAQDSGKAFAGGVPFVLPFGTIYSTNITADATTGIGAWTDDQFVKAVHDGIRNDGKRLYPAFPYTSYTQLSRSDVLAIKAYIFSLPTIAQANKEPDLGFPFNQRWAMGFWNALFFKSQRFASDATQSAQWNTGAYLATGLGHCGECHTPRNLGYGLEHGNELAGESIQGWRAYNITSDATHGIGAWSDSDIVSYLTTGHAEGRGSAGGPMGEAVDNSLQFLRAEDAMALVTYLRTVPARTGKQPIDVNPAPAPALASGPWSPGDTTTMNKQGLKLFESACASCHQWNGKGQQTNYAALQGLRSVNDPEGSNAAAMILHGVDMRIQDADVFMPAFGHAYTDTEVAQLANYVIGHFGDKRGVVTPANIADLRKK